MIVSFLVNKEYEYIKRMNWINLGDGFISWVLGSFNLEKEKKKSAINLIACPDLIQKNKFIS